MVFSPSLKTSTNSLFAAAEDNKHQELRASRKNEVPSSRVAADDDDNRRVIMAPLLASGGGGPNGGGDSSGAAALTIEVDGTAVSSDDVLAAIPGAADASLPSPTAEKIVSSPQDKDFVEEVRL